MSQTRISPKVLRDKTESAKQSIEQANAKLAQDKKDLERSLARFYRDAIQKSCDGNTLVQLTGSIPKPFTSQVSKDGFEVFFSEETTESLMKLQDSMVQYENSIREIYEGSTESQLLFQELRSFKATGLKSLFKLLGDVENYRLLNGESNDRDYFSRYVVNNNVDLLSKETRISHGLADTLDQIWIHFVWYRKAKMALSKKRRELKKNDGESLFASWENADSTRCATSINPGLLKWLATDGQTLLDSVDTHMGAMGSQGCDSVNLEMTKKQDDWICMVGNMSFASPSIDLLCKIMKARGFRCKTVDRTLTVMW